MSELIGLKNILHKCKMHLRKDDFICDETHYVTLRKIKRKNYIRR